MQLLHCLQEEFANDMMLADSENPTPTSVESARDRTVNIYVLSEREQREIITFSWISAKYSLIKTGFSLLLSSLFVWFFVVLSKILCCWFIWLFSVIYRHLFTWYEISTCHFTFQSHKTSLGVVIKGGEQWWIYCHIIPNFNPHTQSW